LANTAKPEKFNLSLTQIISTELTYETIKVVKCEEELVLLSAVNLLNILYIKKVDARVEW
jgi:hypothetical protein